MREMVAHTIHILILVPYIILVSVKLVKNCCNLTKIDANRYIPTKSHNTCTHRSFCGSNIGGVVQI